MRDSFSFMHCTTMNHFPFDPYLSQLMSCTIASWQLSGTMARASSTPNGTSGQRPSAEVTTERQENASSYISPRLPHLSFLGS